MVAAPGAQRADRRVIIRAGAGDSPVEDGIRVCGRVRDEALGDLGFVLGTTETLRLLVRPEPDLRRDSGGVVDAGKSGEVEAIVGESCNGGTFAKTRP
ncbi:unnamed protein product [Hyaloperonospora brassicae]|uniref:Uncharacterized protein n=1 Tax=Hyaloperonospora brassicae TaxID=162125 RepID=A0AAV0TJ09_HYABA|nr:unnamed protein product [Hyaloperonospora brassicae]